MRRQSVGRVVTHEDTVDNVALTDELENLRRGTAERFESNFVFVGQGDQHEFEHGFDEVPWYVDVLVALAETGDAALSAPALVTFTKSRNTVVVANGTTVDYSVQVRVT